MFQHLRRLLRSAYAPVITALALAGIGPQPPAQAADEAAAKDAKPAATTMFSTA